MEKDSYDITNLLNSGKLVKVCAPMVRYSRLPFRKLVREYGCDLCFSPMVEADSYIRSVKAREELFYTDSNDSPVVVQFAANNANDFVRASELIAPQCNGVDLNCGCPQRWAFKEGYGVYLLDHPELVKDCVLQLRNRIPHPFTVSVKMRLLPETRKTVDLCKQLEMCGVSFLTVHGRTANQRSGPVNKYAFRDIRQSVKIPIILNGDIKSLSDAHNLYQEMHCNGVMSARGLLENPALFAGFARTPIEVIQKWLTISHKNLNLFHNHLNFMCHKLLTKHQRQELGSLSSSEAILLFLQEKFSVHCENKELWHQCDYPHFLASN